jgi:hypothetical protein
MPRKPTKKAKKKSPASVRRDGIEISDADKLRLLATWIDLDDVRRGVVGTEVQDDLRRIAKQIETTGDEGRKLEEIRKMAERWKRRFWKAKRGKDEAVCGMAAAGMMVLRILESTPTAKGGRR